MSDGPAGPSGSAIPGVVYVVAKLPRAGSTKTRLSPPLTPVEAATLAEAMLIDTLQLVQVAGFTPRIVCRDAAEQAALAELAGPGIAVIPQTGAGLGQALESAFDHGFRDGFPAVAVLGPDSPTLPPSILHDAFQSLDSGADLAIGPAEDGGYYLLAAHRRYPELFRDVPWSTSQVMALTLVRCRQAGLRVRRLPLWYDVDDAESLDRLRRDLVRAAGPAATRAWNALVRPAPE